MNNYINCDDEDVEDEAEDNYRHREDLISKTKLIFFSFPKEILLPGDNPI